MKPGTYRFHSSAFVVLFVAVRRRGEEADRAGTAEGRSRAEAPEGEGTFGGA